MKTDSKIYIDRLFSLLDDWRNLPAYQLERRADIFFAVYLDKIIKAKFDTNIDFIVPEFPLRVGAVYDAKPTLNSSFKIDYVAVCETASTVYLVELKTDQSSRRDKQDWYLQRAKEIKIKGLIEGIIKIYGATLQKKKYGNLVNLLSEIGWLSTDGTTCIDTSREYDIEVVYIQPTNLRNDLNVITFEDIARYLSTQEDDLTKRFVQSLTEWTRNPNEADPVVIVNKN